MDKYEKLASLMFSNVDKTIDDLELKYIKRNVVGQVTRFAPSPTGFLHTGALFTSLINKQIAKQTKGVFYLRIEDTDKKREVEGSTKSLINEMNIFGITPDEGVISDNNEIGNYAPYTQSKRGEIYLICAKYLVSKGLAYPCFCTSEMLDISRASQEKNKQRTGYYGVYAKCRNLDIDEMITRVSNNEKYIVRLKSSGSHLKKLRINDVIRGELEMSQNDQDLVIIKSDNLPTYHFAHVVDDHFMRTTLAMRGEEWISSIPIHVELFNKLNFEIPKYGHFPTIMVNDNGCRRKLSKRRDKQAAVSYFLESGYETCVVIEYLLGIINSDFESWRNKNKDKDILDFEIRLDKMSTSGALFDMDKLNNISKEYIANLTTENLLLNLINWSNKYDKKVFDLLNKDLEYSKVILSIERDNVVKKRKDLVKYSDFLEYFFYFFDELFFIEKSNIDININLDNDIVNNIKKDYINIYNENDDKDIWWNKIKDLAIKYNFCTDMKEYKQNKEKYIGSIADVANILRVNLTARTNTPDIYLIMKALR
ncbi:MAG: glutamate--tRNA ligase family protein [Clostridia bacterium]